MYNYCTYTIILTIDCTTFPNTPEGGNLDSPENISRNAHIAYSGVFQGTFLYAVRVSDEKPMYKSC